MSVKTYHGSCHCGRIRYETRFDLSQGTGKCNCSICTKNRLWGVIVKPDDFKLLAGENDLADYQFGTRSAHHHFCKNCGVHPFGKGYIEQIGGAFYMVNVLTLDDIDVQELVESPVRYADGRNNNWHAVPAEHRHL